MDGKDVAEAVAAVAAMMGKIQNPKVKAAAKVVHKAAPAVAVAAQVGSCSRQGGGTSRKEGRSCWQLEQLAPRRTKLLKLSETAGIR